MTRRRVVSLISAGLIIVASLFTTALPAAGKGHMDVLLDGLSSPKGIAVGPKSVVVSQGAFGPPGPVLEYLLTGRGRGTARPLTDGLNLVDITATPDGAGWAIGGDLVIYRQATPGGAIDDVLSMVEYQASDPDPDNAPPENDPPLPFEDPAETNPFGLAALANNDVLIADAAANDIVRVSPNGDAHTVARFPREEIAPGQFAEAVPTSIAIGRDGWAYVGQLTGAPGIPGASHIWRLNPNAVGATCSAVAPNPDCRVWKSGFTSIIDLAFNPHNRALYVYEVAKGGWVAFEEGFGTGVFPPAVLLEVKGKKVRELVPGQLSQPGGVAVSKNGTIFVTDGMFSDGRLIRLRGS